VPGKGGDGWEQRVSGHRSFLMRLTFANANALPLISAWQFADKDQGCWVWGDYTDSGCNGGKLLLVGDFREAATNGLRKST
jgi:hypothetical protein